jgi:DNA mismatch repair ATPase MutS
MSLEGFVSIDANTSRGLQLITSNDCKSKKLSLFYMLNYCQTPMGGKNEIICIKLFTMNSEKMLRSNLLQPPNNIEIINARLDVVEKFLESEEMFFETISILKQIPDLDSINNSLGKLFWIYFVLTM